MNVINHTQNLDNGDGRSLFLQKWGNENSASKNLLIVHGLGEHSEAYSGIANILAHDINVHAFDFTGHGKSSGQRGYVGDIEWLLHDLKTVCGEIGGDLNILAHSLGGLVVVTAIQREIIKPPQKLILSNPCMGLRVKVPGWKKLGAELLTKSIPRVTLGNEISPEDLSKDPEYIQAFKKDPLRHQKISPRLYLGMMDLIDNLNPSDFPKDLETLLLLSKKDPICNPMQSETYFSQQNNKKLHFFEDSMHEILNDYEKETAHQLIKDFVC